MRLWCTAKVNKTRGGEGQEGGVSECRKLCEGVEVGWNILREWVEARQTDDRWCLFLQWTALESWVLWRIFLWIFWVYSKRRDEVLLGTTNEWQSQWLKLCSDEKTIFRGGRTSIWLVFESNGACSGEWEGGMMFGNQVVNHVLMRAGVTSYENYCRAKNRLQNGRKKVCVLLSEWPLERMTRYGRSKWCHSTEWVSKG